MSPILDSALWELLLRCLRDANVRRLGSPAGRASGRIGWYERSGLPEGSEQAAARISAALREDDRLWVEFAMEIFADGRASVSLRSFSGAVENNGPYPETLELVEDAMPAPWRKLPDPTPDARPAGTVDLALLEQVLREKLSGAIGATEAEIAAAEARLGFALPDELKVLYRVWSAQPQEIMGDENHSRLMDISFEKLGFEPLTLDAVHAAIPSTRRCSWQAAATLTTTVDAAPEAQVQELVGSPGWIAFADSGSGDRFVLDMTPGPGGHLGQVIMICHRHIRGRFAHRSRHG